jgi:hypothetical protein
MRSRWLVVLVLVAVAVTPAGAAGAAGATARGWQRPVDGPVLRPFSLGPDRFAAGQHRGVDLAAAPATRVRAACGGRVGFAGRVPRGGLTVSVRCGRLIATLQHLGAIVVRRGQLVRPGALIGRAGSARARPHVHLGARVAATGAYVDPLDLLAGAPRAVPPPLPAARRPPPLRSPPVSRPPLRVRPVPVTRSPLRVRPVPVSRPPLRVRPVRVVARRDPRALARELPGTIKAPPAPTARMPWPVWLGLALVGLGLPLGGLVRVRARRRRPALAAARAAS